MQKNFGESVSHCLGAIFVENAPNIAPLNMTDTLYQFEDLSSFSQFTEECAFHCRLHKLPVKVP